MAAQPKPRRPALDLGDESLARMPDTFQGLNLEALPASNNLEKTPRPVIGARLAEVELSAVVQRSPIQARAAFDPARDEEDQALVRSLQLNGQRVPVLLDELDGAWPPRYALKDGHRRCDALKFLGQARVLAVITREGSLEADLLALTANVRKNLTPLETARAVERLRERHSLEVQQIVERTGLTRQYVRQLRELTGLSSALQKKIEEGRLGAKAGYALSRLPAPLQDEVARLAEQHDLTEPDAKRLADRIAEGASVADAAQSLGLALSDSSVVQRPPVGAADRPVRARRRNSMGRRPVQPLDRDGAERVLRLVFPQLVARAIVELAEKAHSRQFNLRSLKLAGLFALAGWEAQTALATSATLEPEAAIRKLLALLDLITDLQETVRRGKFVAAADPLLPILGAWISRLRDNASRP